MRPYLRNAFEVLQRRHEVSTRGLTSAEHPYGCGTAVAPLRLTG